MDYEATKMTQWLSACCTTIGPRVQVSITYIKSLSMTSPAPIAAGL